MDDHFNQMLAPLRQSAGQFIASKTFTGSKQGYYFTTGPQGLGYYEDVLTNSKAKIVVCPIDFVFLLFY